MNKKHKAAVAAALLLTITFIVIPAAYGVQPDSAGVLYATYLDWLQGKPVGLAQVNPVLPHSVEKATLVVVDYTSGSPKVIYTGSFISPLVKIKRIPIRTEIKTEFKDGRATQVTVTQYKPVQLLVIVSARDYWGAKFIEFTPEKPLTHVNVRVPLYRDGVKESVKNFGKGFQVTTNSIGDMYMNVKILRLHSVPGVTEEIDINYDASLALDSFSQAVSEFGTPSKTGWKRSGAVTTPFGYLAPVPTSNGEMKTIYGHVRYDVEITTVCGYLICRNIYTLHPEEIEYFSKIQRGRDPGTIPSNLVKRTHWKSAGNTFLVYFDKSSNDGSIYFSTAVSVCLGGEYGSICFSGTADSYRKTSGGKPVIKVIINSWHGDRLYFAPYSSRGNYYEVYLQWG